MRAVVPALATSVVLLAGCSSYDNEIAKPLAQVIADARHARDSASSVHVSGTFDGMFWNGIEFDLRIAKGKGETGWMYIRKEGLPNGRFDLRAIGTDLYMRGNFASLARARGSSTPPKGAWLKASTTSGPLAKLYSLVAPAKLFPLLDADLRTLKYRGYDDLDGRGTEIMIDSRHGGGELRIAANGGKPYPDSVQWEDKATGVSWTDWNAPVSLNPPRGAIDASVFGLG